MKKRLVLQALGVTAVAVGLVLGPMQLLAGTSERSAATTSQAHGSQAPADAPALEAPHQAHAAVQAAGALPAEQAPSGIRRLGLPARERGTNFVSVCRYSHSAPDDPIVHPGHAGASHLHDFFGNTTTRADSTRETLLAGSTTCRIEGDTAAYWTPALYDSGVLVAPQVALVYYTPGAKSHTHIQAFPAGLKVVAKEDNVVARYACVGKGENSRGQMTPPTCPEGTHLVIRHRFPDCWDGRNLDSDDHTSHMTFAVRRECPSSHPVPMPAISVNVHYPSDGGEIVLGSPDSPQAPHADFFNGWDQPTLERLVKVCLNAGVHCGRRPPAA